MKKTRSILLLTSIVLTGCNAKKDYGKIILEWRNKIVENEKFDKDYKNSLLIFTGFLGNYTARIFLDAGETPTKPKYAAIAFHSEVCLYNDYYQCLSFTIAAFELNDGRKTYFSVDTISKPYSGYDYQSWRDSYKYFSANFMFDLFSYTRGANCSYDHVYEKTITPTEKMILESEQVTEDLLYFTITHVQTWIQSSDFHTIFPSFKNWGIHIEI